VADERLRFRLKTGLGQLEQWAANAGPAQKNIVYKALFAVTDGTVFRTHFVLRDSQRAQQYFVLVKDDLVVKIWFSRFYTFGILYIGPRDDAPGLDLTFDAA